VISEITDTQFQNNITVKKDSFISKDRCITGESIPPRKIYQLKKNKLCLIYNPFNSIETESHTKRPSMQHLTVQMAKNFSSYIHSQNYNWIMQILFTHTQKKLEIVDKRKISR